MCLTRRALRPELRRFCNFRYGEITRDHREMAEEGEVLVFPARDGEINEGTATRRDHLIVSLRDFARTEQSLCCN